MSTDPEGDLRLLLEDVFRVDGPGSEQIARYVERPETLTDRERYEIEYHIEHTPGFRDAVNVVRNYRVPPVEADVARAAASARRPPEARRWRSVRSWGSLLALAAAGILLAFVFRMWTGGTTAPGRSSPPLVTAQTDTPEPDASQDEPALPATQDRPAPSDAPSEEREGAPRPAPTAIADANTPRLLPARRDSKRETADASPSPTPAPELDESLIASAELEYATPFAVEPRAPSSGLVRGSSGPILTGLAPRHVARTLSGTPTLAWQLSELPASGARFKLEIVDEDAPDLVLQRAIPAPARAGLQRTSLSDLGFELRPGVEYSWFVMLEQGEDPSSNPTAQGWIRRVDDAGLKGRVSALPPAQRPALLATSGYWYDAVDSILSIRESEEDEARWTRALDTLLERSGVLVSPTND